MTQQGCCLCSMIIWKCDKDCRGLRWPNLGALVHGNQMAGAQVQQIIRIGFHLSLGNCTQSIEVTLQLPGA